MPARLQDVYEPEEFALAIDEKVDELNAFATSGIVVEDPRLTAMAAGGGRSGEMPSYNPLEQNEPNYSSDDPAAFSTPDKITSNIQSWRLFKGNKSWSTMDFAVELAAKDPFTAITSKIGQYWATEMEKRVIQASLGLYADNVANDASDMVHDVSIDTTEALASSNLIGAENVLLAQQTAGDANSQFGAIALHSVVLTRLKINNLIQYIPDAGSEVLIPFYQALRVVEDDSMPAIMGTNKIKYVTMLFKNGLFAKGKGRTEEHPTELERIPSAGDGGGQTIIHTRKNEILHPWGFTYTNAVATKLTPTLADLAKAENWDRKFSRKKCGVAFLITNG